MRARLMLIGNKYRRIWSMLDDKIIVTVRIGNG